MVSVWVFMDHIDFSGRFVSRAIKSEHLDYEKNAEG